MVLLECCSLPYRAKQFIYSCGQSYTIVFYHGIYLAYNEEKTMKRITNVQELSEAITVIYHYHHHGKPVSEECEVVGGAYLEKGEWVIDLVPITEGARGQRYTVNLLVCGIITDSQTGLNLSTNTECWLEMII